MKPIALFVLLALCLASCSTLEQGVVVEKWYELPCIVTLTRYEIQVRHDQTTRIKINEQFYDGEDFCVKVKGLNKRGRELIKVFYLPAECWDSVYIGQHFCVTKNCFTYDFTCGEMVENAKPKGILVKRIK